MRSFITGFLFILFLPGWAQVEYLTGKSGEVLAQAIQKHYWPSKPIAAVWETLSQLDGRPGVAFDPFTLSYVTQEQYLKDYTVDGYANLDWWISHPSDLVNAVVIPKEVNDWRKDFPVADFLYRTSFDNGFTQIGIGMISDVETDMYFPPLEMKGDFARAILYMILMYHDPATLNARGFTMIKSDGFPYLTRYAQRVLMQYNAEDPVDEHERLRNRAIASLQGTNNPLVDYPELINHLWGEKVNEPFIIKDAPTPLRGKYKLSDKTIDLFSPYIPQDAKWEIDGVKTDAKFISTHEVGIGKHELKYTSPQGKGKLIINIRP